MKRTRVSVTELDQWQVCRMKWYYAQRLGLRPRPEEAGVSPTLSGSAIHFGLEAGLGRVAGANPMVAALEGAFTYLEAHGVGGARYKKGVQAALLGVPEEYWTNTAHVAEEKLEVDYDGEVIGWSDVTMVGKPDIYFYNDNSITIVDAKSSSKDEADRALAYQQWNMQPHYYAVLLEDHFLANNWEVPPIYIKHTILSTRGKHFYGAPYLVGVKHRIKIRERMLKLASEIAMEGHGRPLDVFTDGRIEYMCKMCDFESLDALALTGRDTESMIEEMYTTREQRLW